jgi:hypothetical protein
VEVIQKFAHGLARRRDRKDATERARAYIELLRRYSWSKNGTHAKGCACFGKAQR